LAVAAGIATLKLLKRKETYQQLEERAAKLTSGMLQAASETGIPVTANRAGSMFTVFFNPSSSQNPGVPESGKSIIDWTTAKQSDTKRFAHFFWILLKSGIYIAPSQFEAAFLSTAHTDEDIDVTLDAVRKALKSIPA
jgi:glutamate-1-semialdehyde 2,1-aminomutase